MKKNLQPKALSYPAPVYIIGTYDSQGNPDAMNAAWGGICCSNPPCVTVSFQKIRKSYENILETNGFTVNFPSALFIKEADYFGLVSGKNINKFEKTGLTAVKSEFVNAPYIDEFPVALECKLINKIELGSHVQCVGEILNIKADDKVLDENGLPDIKKMDAILFETSRRNYYKIGEFAGKAFEIGNNFLDL